MKSHVVTSRISESFELMKDMDEITIIGTVSKTASGYVVYTDDGTEYQLSAILPWEAVPTDFGSVGFEMHLGKRMKIFGLTDGNTIYRARLTETESEELSWPSKPFQK